MLSREKLPAWQLAALALVMVVWLAAMSLVLTPIFDQLLKRTLFGWIPAWFILETNFAAMPPQVFPRFRASAATLRQKAIKVTSK